MQDGAAFGRERQEPLAAAGRAVVLHLLFAGHETTTGILGNCLWHLSTRAHGVSNAVGFAYHFRTLSVTIAWTDVFVQEPTISLYRSGYRFNRSLHAAFHLLMHHDVSDSSDVWCRSIAMQANPHALSWEALYRDRHI